MQPINVHVGGTDGGRGDTNVVAASVSKHTDCSRSPLLSSWFCEWGDSDAYEWSGSWGGDLKEENATKLVLLIDVDLSLSLRPSISTLSVPHERNGKILL